MDAENTVPRTQDLKPTEDRTNRAMVQPLGLTYDDAEDRLAEVSGEELAETSAKIVQLRAISHQMAAREAPFFHPQLAAQDGKTIRPIIEITGYPGSKEIAPPIRSRH
jgi:hypothetical protein